MIWRALGVLGFMMLAGCSDSPERGAHPSTPGVLYEFVWSDRSEVMNDDGTWTTESDAGYTVDVSSGLLTISTVQLIPCDDAQVPDGSAWLLRAFDWLFAVRSARAGHGVAESDPSAVLAEQIERLSSEAATVMGPAELGAVDYCGLHVLFGPSLVARPTDEVEMDQHVLHLEGSWRRGEGSPVSFTVHTELPTAALVDLEGPDGAALRIPKGSRAAVVQVERELRPLFDGIDFETMSDDARDKAILLAVVDELQARVVAMETDSPGP